MSKQKRVLAVIMGGGRGTRLAPLTQERCKPAVPLAGKYRIVDIPISNCINSGIDRIFLLTQFNTASLHRHIQGAFHFDPFGGGFVDILSAEQTEKSADWYQGTADAVRRNIVHFRSFPHDLVLILSGDQLYRMDFQEIIDQHLATNAEVTVAAIACPVSRIEGLGIMRVGDDLSIQEFVEKPKDPAVIAGLTLSSTLEARLKQQGTEKHCLASMGIYVFNRSVLAEALDNSMTDFGREVIPGLPGKRRVFSYIYEGYWEDIGTVRSFFEANLALAQPMPPFNFFDPEAPIYTQLRYLPASKLNRCAIDQAVIGDGSILTDSKITHCVIGIRSFVDEGTELEDVVVMGADYYESVEQIKKNVGRGRPPIGIGKRCRISRAIIDGEYFDGAIVIRDGVLVVPKGATLQAGTTL